MKKQITDSCLEEYLEKRLEEYLERTGKSLIYLHRCGSGDYHILGGAGDSELSRGIWENAVEDLYFLKKEAGALPETSEFFESGRCVFIVRDLS